MAKIQSSAAFPDFPCLHCLIMRGIVIPYRMSLLTAHRDVDPADVARHLVNKILECASDYIADAPDLEIATSIHNATLKNYKENWEDIIHGNYKSMREPLSEPDIPVTEGAMPSWWPKKSSPDDPADDDGSTPTTG